MQDVICGTVSSVIDGGTFILNVKETNTNNQNNYNKWERVRIRSIVASELWSLRGLQDKVNLEKALHGKKIRCSVHSRDPQGTVAADVKII